MFVLVFVDLVGVDYENYVHCKPLKKSDEQFDEIVEQVFQKVHKILLKKLRIWVTNNLLVDNRIKEDDQNYAKIFGEELVVTYVNVVEDMSWDLITNKINANTMTF